MLKIQLDKQFLRQVVISTVDKWNILNNIKDQTQMIELLKFFVMEPRIFPRTIFYGENEENLLHILSRDYDLSVLLSFLKISFKYNNIDREQLMRFLQSANKNGYNFLHLVCSKPIALPVLLEVIVFLQKQFGFEFIIELMKAKTKNGNNLLNLISRYQEPDVFLEMWKWLVKEHEGAAKNLIKHRNHKGLNNPQIMIIYNSNLLFQTVPYISTVHHQFEDKDLFENLVIGQDKESDAFFHTVFTRNPKVFLDILQMKDLDRNLIEKMFFLRGASNDRIMDKLCTDLENFKGTFTVIYKRHGLDLTRSILYNGDENENSALLHIVRKNQFSKISEYLKWILENYKEEFTFNWIRKRNTKKQMLNAFLLEDLYGKLNDWVVENLCKDIVEKVETNQVPENLAFFLHYGGCTHKTKLIDFLKMLFKNYDKGFIQQILMYKENEGSSFLHYVGQFNDKICIIELLKLLFDNLETSFVVELLLSKNCFDYTFLHELGSHIHTTPFIDMFELLFDKLDNSTVVELICCKNKFDYTFLHELGVTAHHALFEGMVEFFFDKLEQKAMLDIIFTKNSLGGAILHLIILYNDKILYVEFIQNLFFKLERNIVTDFLLIKNNLGYSFLHMLAKHNAKISFIELLKLLIDLLEQEKVEKLLLYQTCNGETFLHMLSKYNKTFSFKELLEFLFDKLKTNVVKHILFSTDKVGCSLLHVIKENQDAELIDELLIDKLGQRVNELLVSDFK